MMIQVYIYLSSPIAGLVVFYTLLFLYIIIPLKFRGNTLKKDSFQDLINKHKKDDTEPLVGGNPNKKETTPATIQSTTPATIQSTTPATVEHTSQSDSSDIHLEVSQDGQQDVSPEAQQHVIPEDGQHTVIPATSSQNEVRRDDKQVSSPDVKPVLSQEEHQANYKVSTERNPIAQSNNPTVEGNIKVDNVIVIPSDQVDISTIVNDNKNEDYSIINIWKGIKYKYRYLYLLITIIFVIDLSLSEIIDKKYNYVNYIIGFVILIIMLFFGFFFNLLTCNPDDEDTKDDVKAQAGGGYITTFFKNKTWSKNSFWINDINNFSEKNPLTIIKDIKFEINKCNLTIENNSYVKSFKEVFDKISSIKNNNEEEVEMTQVAVPIYESSPGELIKK